MRSHTANVRHSFTCQAQEQRPRQAPTVPKAVILSLPRYTLHGQRRVQAGCPSPGAPSPRSAFVAPLAEIHPHNKLRTWNITLSDVSQF
jgi:hypothetical protein